MSTLVVCPMRREMDALVHADIHGKTGTAQNPHGEDHSWFAGYMAIDNNPVISLSVLVEHGGKGSIQGAMISRKIFEFFLQNELIQ